MDNKVDFLILGFGASRKIKVTIRWSNHKGKTVVQRSETQIVELGSKTFVVG